MMRRFKTLRARFALWTAGLLLLALAGFGVVVYVLTARSLAASVDDSLHVSAAQAVAALTLENGQLTIEDSLPNPAQLSALRDRGLTIRIIAPGGQLLQAIGPYRDLPPTTGVPLAGFASVANPASGNPVRWYTSPISERVTTLGYVQVGQGLDAVNDTLNQLLAALLLAAPLLVIGAAIGGYLLAARALRPLATMTRTAQRISAADLHARLNLPHSDDEVGRLAQMFDGMLARLEESFQRERRFTADASHELRTPLAAMQAILGVVRERERTPAEYQQALEDLTAQTARLRALTEDLLQLARFGTPRPPAAREQIPLSTQLDDLIETLRPLAADRELRLTSTIATDLGVSGDSDSLIRLWLNLLDNALKYTVAGHVQVLAQRDGTTILVQIRDSGPGIAPEHLPQLFDRFYRGDTARTTVGAGLGLALAREIVHAHAGTITIASTRGQGTTVSVRLPAAN